MARVAVALALAIALLAGRAGAEEPHDTGTRVTATQQPKQWYGWKILTLDTAALVTMTLGRKDAVVFMPGYVVWGFGAPMIHASHRNGVGALLSLGLRAAGTVGALYAIGGSQCPEDAHGYETDCAGPFLSGVTVLAVTSLVDAALLAHASPAPDVPSRPRGPPPRRERPPSRFSFLRVTPTVGAAPHGVFVGATGTF